LWLDKALRKKLEGEESWSLTQKFVCCTESQKGVKVKSMDESPGETYMPLMNVKTKTMATCPAVTKSRTEETWGTD